MSFSQYSDLFAEPQEPELKLAAQVPSLLSCSCSVRFLLIVASGAELEHLFLRYAVLLLGSADLAPTKPATAHPDQNPVVRNGERHLWRVQEHKRWRLSYGEQWRERLSNIRFGGKQLCLGTKHRREEEMRPPGHKQRTWAEGQINREVLRKPRLVGNQAAL